MSPLEGTRTRPVPLLWVHMAPISRSSVLNGILIVIIAAALPGAIRRLYETGDLYLFTRHFFADMMARLSGPGRLRFILQPVIAILLGTRDGVKDARAASPSLLSCLFHSEHRSKLLRSAFASVRDLVAIAILLDIISQFLIFRQVHPGAALVLGPLLIGVPYALTRALANRIARWRVGRAPATHAS